MHKACVENVTQVCSGKKSVKEPKRRPSSALFPSKAPPAKHEARSNDSPSSGMQPS